MPIHRLSIVVFATLVVVVCGLHRSDTSDEDLFRNFIVKYNKHYSTYKEVQYRLSVFKSNLRLVETLNAESSGTIYGVNGFSDLTHSEYVSFLRSTPSPRKSFPVVENEFPQNTPPYQCPNTTLSTCDWRAAGVVTPVGNQGQCAASWIFSNIAALEGACALANGTLTALSGQQLMSCCGKNQGCNGDPPLNTFKCIMAEGGIESEAEYPFNFNSDQCLFNKSLIVCSLKNYYSVPTGNETELTIAIENYGPVNVYVDASQSSFEKYTSGVYYSSSCSSTQLDHSMAAVGFGTLKGQDFYICKNSWGSNWGMDGYILMARNRKNNCGIATEAQYAVALP